MYPEQTTTASSNVVGYADGRNVSQVGSATAMIGKQAEELRGQIARLEERLGPVLKPEPTHGESVPLVQPKEMPCPLAAQLEATAALLQDSVSTVMRLVANLGV